MEDFASILVTDYGLKPQGKSAPMSSTKVSPGVGSSRGRSYGSDRKGSVSGRMSGNASTFSGQEDVPYISRKNGSSKVSGRSTYGGNDLFSPGNYDDVFGGPPKSSSAGPRYDDVFGETSESGRAPVYDDLFGGLGVNQPKGKVSSPRVGSPGLSDRSNFPASDSAGFAELLPGFSSEPPKSRSSGDAVASHDEDPFMLPLIDDPLITTPNNSNSAPFINPIDPMDVFTLPSVPPINTTTDAPRASSNASVAFDGFDIFDGYTNQSSTDASKPRDTSQSLRDDLRKFVEDINSNHSTGLRQQSPTDETEPSERHISAVEPTGAYNIASKSSSFFSYDGVDTAARSVSSSKRGDDPLFSSPLDSPVPFKARSRSSPFGDVKEKWFTVNDVKLVTKPSLVPPPSRPPPVPGSGTYGSRSRVDHMESGGQESLFMSSSWPSANPASAAFGNSSEEEQTGGGTPGGSRKGFFGMMDSKTNASNQRGDDEKDVEEDAAAIKAREKEKQEKERQERAALEAKRRAAARERAKRERERADTEAAEKAARREKEQQRRSEHDLDAIFNPGKREDPAPQPTSNSGEDPARNKRSGAADRSRDRAARAIEEMKKRESEMQREQDEKYRAADQLDAEIKRWAAGKERNLRALLSTLQYVLWPECGWQPVSLSDLITAASVKRTYKKATLFVHPDKVQQKGATVQQKYIAEKVFDLLKEASKKFDSEELF